MTRLTFSTTLLLGTLTAFGASALHAAPPVATQKPRAAPAPPSSKAVPAKAPAKNATPAAAAPTAKKTAVSPVWSVAFAPDGTRVAVGAYQCVRVYDVATGKKVGEWKTGGDAMRSLAFSGDGKMLAAGGGIPGQSGAAWLLDSATGKILRVIRGHQDTVEAVAFAGNTLLTAGDDERIDVSDATSGNGIGKLTEHNGRCLSVTVPPKISDDAGGDIWATGGADNMLKIWDAKARRVVVNFDQCASPVWSLATQVNNPGHFIAGCGDGQVRYFAVRLDKDGKPDDKGVAPRTGNIETAHPAHEGPVFALAVAPDQSYLVSGGADNKVCVWGIGGGKRKQFSDATAPIGGVSVAPDGKKIASASLDGKCRIYNAETGSLLLTLGISGPEDPPVQGAMADPRLLALLPKTPASGTGLSGSYWNGREIGGAPVITRLDKNVEFRFPRAGQGPGIESEEFSARWEGFVEAPKDGQYRFFTTTDDGVRLWLNGKPVIDEWHDAGGIEYPSALITLKAGERVPLRMEYYQGGGAAMALLQWEYPGQTKQIVPTTSLYPIPALPKGTPKTAPKPPAVKVQNVKVAQKGT